MEILSELDCSCLSWLSPMAVVRCLCCICIALPKSCLHGLDCCCACFCSGMCDCCQYASGLVFHACSSEDHNISCAILLLWVLVTYCVVVGVLCISFGALFTVEDCGAPFSVHLLVLGIGMIAFGGFFLRVYFKYYRKTGPSGVRTGAVFHAFWILLKNDILLTCLTVCCLFTVAWAFVGLVWLSSSTCASERRELSMDSFASISMILVGASAFVWTLLLFTLMSCDEGSCTYDSCGVTCFLCCCICCVKAKAGFHNNLSRQCQRSRSLYPTHRNACLSKALKTLVALGFLRREFAESRYRPAEEESRVEILQNQVAPELTGKPLADYSAVGSPETGFQRGP